MHIYIYICIYIEVLYGGVYCHYDPSSAWRMDVYTSQSDSVIMRGQ